ncbi:uncharacterized protein [Rutidosis leptorrhynchoides]|uniref:uncharacterized protein n=1 Tax=Rutidosis leptorrhynchoides TaxID=125765 RepID=UPI003A998A74
MKSQLFFIYGFGVTGKTYLYEIIASKLRSESRIVLTVASSGIAALLLPEGQTAHSIFSIPINIHEFSTCSVKKHSNLAELLRRAELVIWDEAPMSHRFCFEAENRTLNDICEVQDGVFFGGKTFVLGGDFRQTLPMVEEGDEYATISASIIKSELWSNFEVLSLTENMRLKQPNMTDNEKEAVKEFANWIVRVGDGDVLGVSFKADEDENWIKIPEKYLVKAGPNPTYTIFNEVYPGFLTQYGDADYLKRRSIVTPLNDTVNIINSQILSLMPGDVQSYLSYDCLNTNQSDYGHARQLYPAEFLNTLAANGLPDHNLLFKTNCSVMLLRNLDPSRGLCNGTRMIVKRCTENVVEAVIVSGSKIGEIAHIPRISLSAKNKKETKPSSVHSGMNISGMKIRVNLFTISTFFRINHFHWNEDHKS